MSARDDLAATWAEGYEAGQTDARAVQKTYPDLTVNPYASEDSE